MSFLNIAKSQPNHIPKEVNRLSVGLLKKIIANLPDAMEVCFNADQECIGTYGFYKWDIESLIDTDNEDELNDKLVLSGGGEYPYDDQIDL